MSSEQQLIDRAKHDPGAFGELYDRYYPRILRYIFRLTADHTVACDITSEAFLKAWIKIGTFQWKGISISSWFFRIATNELNQYFRRKTYTPHRLLDLSLTDLSAIASGTSSDCQLPDPGTQLEKMEEYRQMHTLLATLAPDYQKVIALRYFEELPIKEISDILRKKEGTVRSLLSRGLDKMKKLMDQPATPR